MTTMKQRLFTLLLALAAITTAWATDYDLWICGTRVTSDNFLHLDNIVGVKSGTVYYSDNTLHLSWAHIYPSDNTVLPIYAESGVNGLTIDVTGVCTIEIDASIGVYYKDISSATITGSGTLIIKANDYDIMFNGGSLTISDGVTVCLMGGGIDNDGNNDEQLVVDSANLFVRRTKPSLSSIYMHELVLRNAYLDSPAWPTYEWSGTELTNGSQWWYGDINIKAGTPPSRSASGGDVNEDGNVTIADVTRLVDIILRGGDEHDYVDLGLPSGTRWATCNIGAESPEEFGLYFAWGETVGHTANEGYDFSVNYYKWYNPLTQKFTKYCTNAQYGTVDNRTELEPTDDAAYVNWGPLWCMPTKQQIEELINPDYTYGFETNINGVLGVRIRSIANGNSIFLPYAGHFSGTFNGETGDGINAACFCWTKSLQTAVGQAAYSIGIISQYDNSTVSEYQSTYQRCNGLPIRPVRAK